MPASVRWTEEQTRQALELYSLIAFGQFDHRNPQVIALAKAMGRTPLVDRHEAGELCQPRPGHHPNGPGRPERRNCVGSESLG